MATIRVVKWLKIFTGFAILIFMLFLWQLIKWYNFLKRLISIFAWSPVAKFKMAAPAAEKISWASDDSPEQSPASTPHASPPQSPGQSPTHSPSLSPAHTPAHSPVQMRAHTLALGSTPGSSHTYNFTRGQSNTFAYPRHSRRWSLDAAVDRSPDLSPDKSRLSMIDPDPSRRNLGYFQAIPVIDSSVQELTKSAEDQLLTLIRTPITREDVELYSRGLYIHTLRTCVPSCASDTVPLLLIHGLASGMGAWTLTIDELAQSRQVFAIDLLGFGQSSRFEFGDDAKTVEQQWVQSIEEWRQKTGLTSFILCGHSLGGFVGYAYALRYPEHVLHLILDDPWGFPESSRLTRGVGGVLMNRSMPYLRAPKLIRDTCLVFMNRAFQAFDKYHGGAGQFFHDYLTAINQAEPATGEHAFGTLGLLFGVRARQPMMARLSNLDERVGVSFLVGERSFLPHTYLHALPARCAKLKITVKLVRGADHEVHITQSQQFSDLVNAICDRVDDVTPIS